jgi:lipoate-protein ligase A
MNAEEVGRMPVSARVSTVGRILPHGRADGPSNMALDDALLESVASDPSMAVVRTYEWTSPTLSLGYFQSMAEVEDDPRWTNVPIVRRPTGGGALWHEHEVTYAVVVPDRHPLARPSRALYRAIHQAIACQLQALGIPARRRGVLSPDQERESRRRPFLCFTDRDEEDLVFRNVKLVGSAQRRRSGAVLQHGSLLLGRSTTTPELPGLGDLAPVVNPIDDSIQLLRSSLSEALEIPFIADEFRPEELLEAEERRARIYSSEHWTYRR